MNLSRTTALRAGTVIALSVPFSCFAQSHIYVDNNTTHNLEVMGLDVTGDPVSKKAFQSGATSILVGERNKVLTLNRAGKVNWMDPTPRFIEPGKTAVFTTSIGTGQGEPLKLRQKILGVGKASKMWYALGDAIDPHWHQEPGEFAGEWRPTSDRQLAVQYAGNGERKDMDVTYRITP